jgi:hypothetical protein
MTQRLRRLLTVVVSFAAALLMLTAAAFATSGAHFFNVQSSVDDNGALIVSYDEAGVGNNTVNYTIDITNASATYACINGGGNHPKAANKETVSGGLSVGFSRDPTNGRVTGATSPPIGPQPKGSFDCPSGQTLVLASVSYTGITLTDTTNNVSTSVPDASRTFVNIR